MEKDEETINDVCRILSRESLSSFFRGAHKVGWPSYHPRHIFTRDSMQCFARLSHREVSVRPSVRLSVTPLSPIKLVQDRITKSPLWAAPRSLVFSDTISCPCVRGFPSNNDVKEGYPLKKRLIWRYWFLQCENGCR